MPSRVAVLMDAALPYLAAASFIGYGLVGIWRDSISLLGGGWLQRWKHLTGTPARIVAGLYIATGLAILTYVRTGK